MWYVSIFFDTYHIATKKRSCRNRHSLPAMTRRKFSAKRPLRPQHNATQAVRAQLGLTQNDLASLMEVSRVAVSMDEHGSRSLPWPQIGLLYALRAALPATPAPPPPPVLTATDRADLEFRRKVLRVAAFPLEEKLERGQLRLAQARCWQQVLPQLRTTFPANNTWAHEWLDMFERRAAITLRRQAGSPALLQVRLAAIAFEITEITRLLGDEPAVGE
jgi:transcriptional regulator with XRE-family HTH domain